MNRKTRLRPLAIRRDSAYRDKLDRAELKQTPPVDRDAQGVEVMGYDEAGGTSSIYCCTFGDQGVTGLQGPFQGRYGISVRDLGEVPDAPVFRTRVDWYVGFAVLQPRAAGRLFNITPAA